MDSVIDKQWVMILAQDDKLFQPINVINNWSCSMIKCTQGTKTDPWTRLIKAEDCSGSSTDRTSLLYVQTSKKCMITQQLSRKVRQIQIGY